MVRSACCCRSARGAHKSSLADQRYQHKISATTCVTRNSNSRCQPIFCMSWCPDFEFRGTHTTSRCSANAIGLCSDLIRCHCLWEHRRLRGAAACGTETAEHADEQESSHAAQLHCMHFTARTAQATTGVQ